MILVLEHDPLVPMGSLGTLLRRRHIAHRLVRLHAGEALPRSPRGASGVIVLGGRMSVRDEERHPFLAEEAGFLRSVHEVCVPILGIGLGAQLLARMLGGQVGRACVEERGWTMIRLTPAGRDDELFAGLPPAFLAFEWHEERFSPPPGAQLLAAGDACPHQAFRLGNAWGVQFHPEVDAAAVASWAAGCDDAPDICRDTARIMPSYRPVATRLFENFLAVASRGGMGG